MKTNVLTHRSPLIGDSTKSRTVATGLLLTLITCLGLAVTPALAQTAGEAAITGTVIDPLGGVVPNATVTAINDATGVQTARHTSSAGVYEISPLIVGTYTVTVSATGFALAKQEDIVLNENQIFGFNPILKVGNQSETISVTSAPLAMDTTNAVLGGTIATEEFMALPILVAGNQQRDVTQFSNYLPGAQAGARSSLFSGTASRVEEVYLDGIPLTTISQIGDNRPIFNLVPSEAIGEIGALTSGQSVEYQGAGSVNYNMRSGGNQYHGTVADFVRNTLFDTWGFTAIAATEKELVNGVDHNRSGRQARRSPERVHLCRGRSHLDSPPVQRPRQALLLCRVRQGTHQVRTRLCGADRSNHSNAEWRLFAVANCKRRTGLCHL